MLYLCISQSCLSLSTVIIAHLSSILLFLFIAQTVLSFTAVIDAHPSFILLFSFFSVLFRFFSFFFILLFSALFFCILPDLALTLDSHFCTSNLHSALLCILQTLLLVLRVISAHLSSICSSYAFHRSCSHSQFQSFLKMGALICSFYAINRHSSHSQQSLLYFQTQLCFF